MSNFIPKLYKKEQITVRIDSNNLLRIDEISKRSGISRSEFINQCVIFALENMEDDAAIKLKNSF